MLLVGSRASHADYTAFMRANAIAITNYHSAFDSDPAIEAQTLVLDDAHAGEAAVADLWSVWPATEVGTSARAQRLGRRRPLAA